MKTINLFPAIFPVILLAIQHVHAQQTIDLFTPKIINTAGNYSVINGQLHDFNIGEMVLIHTFSSNAIQLSQGFLQPATIIPDKPVDPAACDMPQLANNVQTPNGDGKNDLLVFKCLEFFPDNVLTIYDRAGRIVFKMVGYQNNWNGFRNGWPLNEDTYYFVLEAGKNLGRIKGSVSIIRDKF